MKFKTLDIARNVGVLFVNIHTHSEEADPAFAPMDFQKSIVLFLRRSRIMQIMHEYSPPPYPFGNCMPVWSIV